jgi:GNAT superfamily N-acetyltransferase
LDEGGAERKLTIRPAAPGDVTAISELSAQLGYPASIDHITRRVDEICGDESCLLLVCEADGAVVAWLLVHIYRLVTSDRLAQVAGLVVDEASRGRGIGAELMKRAEEWAGENGCRGIMLRSRTARKEAHAFYRRLGYSEIKTQRVFLKEIA